jgi:glycosyltransferase involved in cell wall biosynthesis
VHKKERSGVFIDGRQLGFPGTGLAVVTAEIVRAMARLSSTRTLRVFVERGFEPELFALEQEGIEWVRIPHLRRNPDYLDRYFWGREVKNQVHRDGHDWPLFIPYLHNYGQLHSNIVLVPDLVYRIYPDYGRRDPGKSWWHLKGRLPLRPLVRKWEECRVSAAGKIVVYSAFVADQVSKFLGVSSEQIEVIGLAAPYWLTNGTDEKPKMELPHRFLLYTGGYAARKNVPMLLRVCGRVQEIDPAFRCVFVGLNEERIHCSSEMKAAWNYDGVKSAAVCLPSLSNPQMRWIYNRCEFVVYPSRSEGFGLPVIEAGSCSKLCLCGDNSSMREIQPDANYRISSENEQAWVERILHFWQNPAEASNAGKLAKRNAARFNWNITAEKLWLLFQNAQLPTGVQNPGVSGSSTVNQ